MKPKIGTKIKYAGKTMIVVDYCDKGVIVAYRSINGLVKEIELYPYEYTLDAE